MSVHYDVERNLEAMRKELAQVKTGERSSIGTRIKFRNPKSILASNEMFMTELNRGTPAEDIVEAVLEMTADNLMGLYGGRRDILNLDAHALATRLHRLLLKHASGGDSPKSVVLPMAFDEGGHA